MEHYLIFEANNNIKLTNSHSCDVDTLAVISGAMAYVYYKNMPIAFTSQT